MDKQEYYSVTEEEEAWSSNNFTGSQRRRAEWKKPNSKGHYWMIPFIQQSQKNKPIVIEKGSVGAGRCGWGEVMTAKKYQEGV